MAPLLLWFGYLSGYPLLFELVGAFVPLLGLLPVALVGWTWGAWTGLVGGLVGYVLMQLRAYGLDLAPWSNEGYGAISHSFAVLAYAGTGSVVGWLHHLSRDLRRERAVSQRAQVDPLTGALMRATFEERLREELDLAAETGQGLALLFVDLDRFKFVNDTFGHDVGDKLLREVGRVLRGNVRANDLVGRVGGDEFMVALLGVTDDEAAGQVARSLVRELSAPIAVEERELQVSASIGISLYPRDGANAEELLHSADAAMYQVKQGGKNAYHFSTLEVRTRLSRRLELERKLRRALVDNQLEIVYQPQVRLDDNALVGFEALLRWRSPELGMVSPAEFIPVAEEAGLIAQIGHWTLRESALQQQAWHRQGLLPMRMSVNVSTLQFHQANFVDTVRGALNDSGIDPQLFEIEVTESVLVRDHNLARRTLFRLEHLGVRTALDDFGTGYSSLAYLQRLPISSLKIDRSFVKGLVPPEVNVTGTSSVRGSQVRPVRAPHAAEPVVSTVGERGVVGAAPIVEAICAMAHKLGKEVIAEGIETAYQRDYLRRLGVDLAQGYFFARPLSPLQAEELLRRVTQESLAEERRRRAAASWTAAPHLAPTPRPAAPRASAPPPVAPPPARRDSEPTALDELLLWER
ncbi:MAG: EAL domain-containing protein [Deinococcales bacterium]|nr:EAL domain-containing protein [Deinococcales bacterium]